MFVDGEEKQSGGLAVEVGEIGAFEGGVGRQGCGVRDIKAEGETALEPGFHSVAVGRDDLWGRPSGEGGEMLVEELGGQSVGLVKLAPSNKRDGKEDDRSEDRPRCEAERWNGVDARGSLCLGLQLRFGLYL